MRKTVATILYLLMCISLFAGCSKEEANTTDTSNNTSGSSNSSSNTSATAVEVDFSKTEEDMFTDRDCETDYDESTAIKIQLNGNSATASDSSVTIDGTTITITEDTTHILTGTLNDGMIIVEAEDTAKFQLVFNGVTIISSSSAPLYIKTADKVFVTLVGENTLTSGDEFVAIDDSNINAAVFSKQDLTFNGSGVLNVNSPAGHGIVCKDDLVFTGGTYNIVSASHAIDANDSVRIKEATVTADAGKDGIHSENTDDSTQGFVYVLNGNIAIECEGDGISSGSYTQIEGGVIDILAGGGYENGSTSSSGNYGQFGGGGMHGGRKGTSVTTESDNSTSMKGIKSGNSMLISAGTITVDSADDAIHSNVSAYINGGTFEIASGDDAVHAEENLTVTGGTFNITQSYEGLEALNIAISGGDIKLVATDDGLNAAGGIDSSGTGGRDNMFGRGGHSSSSNGSIVISGGSLYINSSGDAMDANGTLEITGGYTVTTGPTSGDTAVLDYDKTGTISGGTFIGTGSSMMAQTLDGDGQGVIAVSVGNQSAGTKITLTDKDGNVVISHEPELAYQIVIISSPDVISGKTYTISVGSLTSEFEAN